MRWYAAAFAVVMLITLLMPLPRSVMAPYQQGEPPAQETTVTPSGGWTIPNSATEAPTATITSTDTQLPTPPPTATPRPGQVSDKDAPAITLVQIDPRQVDTSSGTQVITLTLHITDDLSGFHTGTIYLEPIDGGTGASARFWYDNHRIEGNRRDGQYRVFVTLPQYAPDGRWRFRYVGLADQVENIRVVYFDWLQYTFINGSDNIDSLYLPKLGNLIR